MLLRMCTVLTPDQFVYGSVGTPMPSVEVKLVDVPEANYLTSSTPQQGEVWIRGPSVISGYFQRDELNKDPTIFTSDGWFRTGDVGQWNGDGTLTIIDRCVVDNFGNQADSRFQDYTGSRTLLSSKAASTSLWSAWNRFTNRVNTSQIFVSMLFPTLASQWLWFSLTRLISATSCLLPRPLVSKRMRKVLTCRSFARTRACKNWS